MRSKLFVPGVRPELFAKALAGNADALSFDLEDSVPADRKQQAREQVGEFVRSMQVRDISKTIIVRVNALGTADLEADLGAVVQAGVDLINLPKVQTAEEIRAVVGMIERIQASNGLAEPIGVLATIETPLGLRNAAEIAAAHPRVAGLQLGLADLFEPFGIDRYDTRNIHATLHAMRMAAAEANVFACDSAFANLHDEAGFLVEARMAHKLGYVGKSCIHPMQVALANEVFMPTAEELAMARRIVQAAGEAETQGRGAFLVDGRMVDLPFLKRAQALVASAQTNESRS